LLLGLCAEIAKKLDFVPSIHVNLTFFKEDTITKQYLKEKQKIVDKYRKK